MTHFPLKTVYDLEIPMRDGTILYADLVRPDDSLPYPALVVRLPYQKDNFARTSPACFQPAFYAENGYCVYVVDCRGCGKSQGVSAPDGSNEILDGYDTVEWVAAQPDCDGNVGMYGLSYFGMTTMAAASTRPPHLKAICPFQCSTQLPIYIHRGGAFNPGHLRWLYGQAKGELAGMDLSDEEKKRISEQLDKYMPQLTRQCMHVPLADTPAVHIEGFPYLLNFLKALDHIEDEAYWNKSGIPYCFSNFDVPMLHVTGWYDSCKSATLENYRLARTQGGSPWMRSAQKLIIGPWVHGLGSGRSIGSIDFGALASPEGAGLDQDMLHWFDYFLKQKGNEKDMQPRVQYFMMGSNQWRFGNEWPLPESKQVAFYLSSVHAANSRQGDGRLSRQQPTECASMDVLIHNPCDPVYAKPWTDMDRFDPMTHDTLGPLCDYASLEDRMDVLVYTTDACDESWEIAGEVTLELQVRITGEDADFFCRLTDVYPDQRSINLTEGALRCRYREGMFHARPMTPGEICTLQISLGDIALSVLPGHRLRLEIASSCYPVADINAGTFERIGYQRKAMITQHAIVHDMEHPSILYLPLLV